MRMPMAARVALAVIGVIAALVGLTIWTNPAEFSGARTGDMVECDASGVCRAYESDFENLDAEGHPQNRVILFEGTETEILEWSDTLHLEATRPIAAGLFVAGGVMLVLALVPGRRERQEQLA